LNAIRLSMSLAPPVGNGYDPARGPRRRRPAEARMGDGDTPETGGERVIESGADGWTSELLGREYDYVTQSSFHSDELRNQYIQFYILLTGAALAAGTAVAESKLGVPHSVLAAASLLIGLVGVLEVAIFVRLRVVVIECLRATVLLKAYAFRHLAGQERRAFESAFLWDHNTLPDGRSLTSASSLLLVLIIILDSAMFAAAAYFAAVDRLGQVGAFQGALAAWAVSAVTQIAVYRSHLAQDLGSTMARSNFAAKLRLLDPDASPERRRE
jgi:hypothetical protein